MMEPLLWKENKNAFKAKNVPQKYLPIDVSVKSVIRGVSVVGLACGRYEVWLLDLVYGFDLWQGS